MFCEQCGEKIYDSSSYCDNCGSVVKKTLNFNIKIKIQRVIGFLRCFKKRLESIPSSRISFVLLLPFIIVSSFFVFDLYTNTQKELKKTQDQLVFLKQSTNEAISAQKTLIEQQSESLSKQDEALKESQANEALLRKTIDSAQNAKVSNINGGGFNQNLLTQIAPSVVKVLCLVDSYSDNIQQGSGILYKANNSTEFGSYFVRTNLHVVRTIDNSQSECVIMVYPDYKSASNYLLFKSSSYKFYNTSLDIAYLTPQLIDKSNSVFAGNFDDLIKYARSENQSPICTSVNVGDHLSVLGYPGIGGDTLTITDGIVSGFEFDYGTRYIKTSAKIEHGNSGGIAIKDSGCVLGIPTFVQSGTVESIGRILDLDYLFSITLR